MLSSYSFIIDIHAGIDNIIFYIKDKTMSVLREIIDKCNNSNQNVKYFEVFFPFDSIHQVSIDGGRIDIIVSNGKIIAAILMGVDTITVFNVKEEWVDKGPSIKTHIEKGISTHTFFDSFDQTIYYIDSDKKWNRYLLQELLTDISLRLGGKKPSFF